MRSWEGDRPQVEARPRRSATSWSSAPDRPGWRLRCMPLQRARRSGSGCGRHRRTGRDVGEDRELPRFSSRGIGQRAGPACRCPGAQVRRPPGCAGRGRPLTSEPGFRDRAFERRGGDRPHRGDRHRGAIPPPRCAAARRVRDGRRLLRRRRSRRRSVLIVGGGNSAGQAAMFLSRHASQCRLLIRGGDLGSRCPGISSIRSSATTWSRSASTRRWSSSAASASSRR